MFMCGINGILEFRPDKAVDQDLLLRMRDAQTHRGPDEAGFHIDKNVGLGHRRLSIIDLASGHQPMTNEDGTVWVTYNGEIFNFLELREELIGKRHQFRTRCDTEVIVHLYEEEGPACAARLRGQFAFAIWDAPKQRLVLARDRLGILPLSYSGTDGRLVFASEIKSILEDPTLCRDVDLTALVDYLTYDYIPAPKTIFEHVRKLPPGHFMVCEWGQLEVTSYWSLAFRENDVTSEEEFLEQIEAKLLDSVKVRLMSDVPLGAFLSGGVDSSTLVALMSRVLDEPVKTFSIGFGEKDFDELPYAKLIAEHFGTEHHEFVVTSETRELLPKLVRQVDEPFADPAAIPTYYVAKMAREHVTVCLSGDGGDEIFGGYTRYRRAHELYERFHAIPAAVRGPLFDSLHSMIPSGMRGKRLMRVAATRTPAELYGYVKPYLDPSLRQRLLSADVRGQLGDTPPYELLDRLYDNAGPTDYVSALQHVDIHSYLPDNILVKTDRTAMMHSLEVRVPLLDYELMELVATTPWKMRIRGKEQKYALKKVLEKHLPPETIQRKKQGFGVPLKYWFERDWKDHTAQMLLDPQSF